MKKYFLSLFVLIGSVIPSLSQVDTDAIAKTKALYSKLKEVQNSSNFLFGQEFFNSFRYAGDLHGDEAYSDSYAVTGSHPAVLGSDFHYYLEKNATERSYHTDAVKWAYKQGYVVTFDWHISARGTSSYEYAGSPPNLLNNIVTDPNGEDRQWFIGELDKVIDIINEDLIVDNDTIPIVFRPFHEMNGNWFWWGSSATSAANYKAFYQLTVDYIKERTRSVLFCWSPNSPFNLDRYPGDEYVDVVGVDAYEVNVSSLRAQLGLVVDYAQTHDKVAVFSETGNRTNSGASPGDNAALYWKDTILGGIADDPSGKSRKIAWVLAWINASWSYPYVPHAGSSSVAKQSFIDFKNSPYVLFGDEIPDMYTLSPGIPVSVNDDLGREYDLQIYPVPTDHLLAIKFRNFKKPVRIVMCDPSGKMIKEVTTMNDEVTLKLKGNMASGVYVIRASDHQKTLTKKFVIN